MVKVIALGVTSGDLSVRAREILSSGERVYLRTDKTESARYLVEQGIAYTSMDYIFDEAEDFDEVYRRIAEILEREDCIYCTDGSGVDDRVIALLHDKVVYTSTSSAYAIMAQAPSTTYSVHSAYDIDSVTYFDMSITNIITDIDSRELAGDIKLILMDVFGEDTVVSLKTGDEVVSMPLHDIDRGERYDYTTTLMIEGKSLTERDRYTFSDLEKIMNILRAPGGCQWDIAQTHSSIRKNLIEEAYELAEGIDLDDSDMMREETGDVLLQAVFHTKIAEDSGEFSINDVISDLCHKLISRHTHIFGNVKANTPEEALRAWETAKKAEKEAKGTTGLKHICETLPALMRADKFVKYIGKRDNVTLQEDSVRERLYADTKGDDIADMLIDIVKLARVKGIDCEEVLTKRLREIEDENR